MRQFQFIGCVLGLVLLSAACQAQDGVSTIREITDLEQYEKQVNAMLRTRLTAEKEYVTTILDMVEEGELPRDLVDRAVLWVQNKRAYAHTPFVYFAKVLELQAERAKIEIPPFDYNIYSDETRSFR